MVVTRMRLGISSLLALLLVCGCVSTQKPQRREVDNRPMAPGDCVSVLIELPNAQGIFTQSRLLDPSGDVSLLYIGTIHLADLTPPQAEKQIHDAYLAYYKELFVTVRRCP